MSGEDSTVGRWRFAKTRRHEQMGETCHQCNNNSNVDINKGGKSFRWPHGATNDMGVYSISRYRGIEYSRWYDNNQHLYYLYILPCVVNQGSIGSFGQSSYVDDAVVQPTEVDLFVDVGHQKLGDFSLAAIQGVMRSQRHAPRAVEGRAVRTCGVPIHTTLYEHRVRNK